MDRQDKVVNIIAGIIVVFSMLFAIGAFVYALVATMKLGG